MLRIAAVLLLAVLPQEGLYSNSYRGKEPPELVSKKADWSNAERPLTLKALRGRAVWLEFSFVG